jgi:nitrogen-specific signal transduction histidine kinase
MVDCRVFFPKTGRHGLVCGAVSPMPEPASNRRAAVLVFRDVTSWRHLEAQYQRTRHLENMQRLAGGLAHQFSNFLTMVSGYSESLAHSIEPADPRFHDVRTIQKVSERASNLTRELMAFSRNQQLNLKVLDTNQAVAHSTDLLKLTSNPAIALEHDFAAKVAKIEVDPAHLDQILSTLVSNARDAMPEGGVITLRTSNMEVDESLANKFVDLPPGSYVRIDVIDRGMGMTYETQTHVFEPFFTTKERARGTGIGLAATYGLVKQNRGHIWFESEPKKGTTFSVCLPQAGSLASVPRSLFGTETVLVVDDSPEARTNARDMLLDLGYRVLEASCGSEAVKICEQTQERIDLVLSNVMMPNMTAAELAGRMASIRPSARILFMSPYSEYSLRRHGALDPSFAVIQRPFNIDALARAVRNGLSGTPQVLPVN